MRACAAALAVLVACSSRPAVREAPEVTALRTRFAGETPMMRDLAELCDRIGGRITGSPAARRAVSWATARFRAMGLDVATEPYPLPFLWLPEVAEVSALAPEPFTIPAVAAPRTPSTPGPIEAPLVDLRGGTPADFARIGESGRGAIGLVATAELASFDGLFAEAMRSGGLLEAAARAGLVALAVQSNRPRGLLHSHAMVFGRTPAALPVAILAREPAARLARLAAASPVRVRLNLVNRIQSGVEADNVVAEIRGRDRPDEIVLLGAHLDSWSLGTGAEDNGVNVALVLDVARALRELGLRPSRTIRFALFTGEEEGLWGSSGYVERHRDELGRHVAAVIFDVGSGRTRGFYLNGRPELAPIVDAALHGQGAGQHVIEPIDGTDNFAFLLSGVPNLVAAQDTTRYLADYHAASDTLERVDAREARRNAGLAAALVWGLASTIERLPPRQRRAEVERLLVDGGLVEQMKAFDQWEDWKTGRVGFPAADDAQPRRRSSATTSTRPTR